MLPKNSSQLSYYKDEEAYAAGLPALQLECAGAKFLKLQKGDLARFTVESDDRELKLRASAAEYQKWAAPLTIVTGGAGLADGRELKLSSPRGAEAS